MDSALNMATNDLVDALLHLTRAQVEWANRPDVSLELLRAAAMVADALDTVKDATIAGQQIPPPEALRG